MKKILTVLAVLLMAIGYTTFTANANDYEAMTAGEELSAEMGEVETSVEETVKCAEDAMTEDGEVSEDCVSEEETEDEMHDHDHGDDHDHTAE
jgi:nucleosome binding factor SPN SPT16 subunit